MKFNQNYWFIYYVLKEKKKLHTIPFIIIPFIFGYIIQNVFLNNIIQNASNHDLKHFIDLHFIRFDSFYNLKYNLKKKNKTILFWINNKILYHKYKLHKGWKKNKKNYFNNFFAPILKLNSYPLKTNVLSKYITDLDGIDLIGKFIYVPQLNIYRLSQKIYNYNLKFNDPFFINVLKKKKKN